MSRSNHKTVHVVNRLNWRRGYPKGYVRVPGKIRIASYPNQEAALQERDQRENETRALVNPFELGTTLPELTSFPAEVFHDWLLDAGLNPPPLGGKERYLWLKWWASNHKKMTAEQRNKVWQALDKVRFFEIEERPALPIVYAVVSVAWAYNDEWYYALDEGGTLSTVFRSREKAEKYCAEANTKEREGWKEGWEDIDDDEYGMWDLSEWQQARQGPFVEVETNDDGAIFVSTDDAPFYEVVEIEWEE